MASNVKGQVLLILSVIFLPCLPRETTLSSPIQEKSRVVDSDRNVTVFNAFIDQDVIAKVNFGTSAQDHISYGKYKKGKLRTGSEDYVIQFMKLPKGSESSA